MSKMDTMERALEGSGEPKKEKEIAQNGKMQHQSCLGKVVWMDEADKNCGIFNSPQRGLVFYDLVKDEFTPVLLRMSGLSGQATHSRNTDSVNIR